MLDLVRNECGVNTDLINFIVVDCKDVKGFEAVASGEKVNYEEVEPGVVAKAEEALAAHSKARAFLLECTQLPAYSDAIRAATGLPVWDAITNCDFFLAGYQQSQRFEKKDKLKSATRCKATTSTQLTCPSYPCKQCQRSYLISRFKKMTSVMN